MANYTLPFTTRQIEEALSLMNNSVAPAFTSIKDYKQGDIVVHDGLLYACKADTPKQAWDIANWELVKIFDDSGYLILNGGDATN